MLFKKLLVLFSILAGLIFNSFAQPNRGFENWTTEYSYEKPDGWQTGNFLSILNPPNPISTFKVIGNDTHSGFYAMKLKTVYINNNPWPGLIDDTTGGIFTGKINLSPFDYKYGYPYAGRPEKLEFWCKYAPVGNDTAEAAIVLQKWNGAGHDTIGGGRMNILSTPQYTLYQITLSYISSTLPDTAAIIFMSSKNKHCARINSTLYIDDVLFTGWVGIDEKKLYADKVKIFPNPARGALNITTTIEKAANVRVIDSFGKLVGEYKIQNNNTVVNTSSFADGLYFYKLLDKKEKVLTNGKFNVIN